MSKKDIIARLQKDLDSATKSLNRAKTKPNVSEIELLNLLAKVDYFQSMMALIVGK